MWLDYNQSNMYIEGFHPKLKKYMHHLRPVDRDIVEHYFGLNGKTAVSIGEIASVLDDVHLSAQVIEERLYRSLQTLQTQHAKATKYS